MADRVGSQTELVFCHECRTEWPQARHGLECPQCHSGFVELIEAGDDPRENNVERDDPAGESSQTSPHDFPSHLPPPWPRDAPDPDEGDIEHVEWNAGPGLRFSRTSYRTSIPGRGTTGQRITDPFGPFFQSFSTIMEGPNGPYPNRPRFPANFEHIPAARTPTRPGSTPGSPTREETPTFGSGRHTVTATTRLWPRDGNNDRSPVAQVDQLQGILGTLLQSLNTVNGMNLNGPHPGPGGPPAGIPFHSIFAQLLNPANAANGDAVYTEEALDRVISQFMEQANGSTAPGPASAEAIQRLPKKEVEKSMMGSDGKAECSVCMDSVEIGDEVTVLPCSHWFHGDCVGAWLKEHDTCPHCRQGIMPKESGGGHVNAPRGPGQPAQNHSPFPNPPFPNPPFPNMAGPNVAHGLHFTWQPSGSPNVRPMEPTRRPSENHRRRSSAREGRNGGEGSSGGGGGEGGGGAASGGSGAGGSGAGGGAASGGGSGGGFSGWVRDRLGRTNTDRH